MTLNVGFRGAAIHALQSLVVRMPAASGTSDVERQILTRAVFEEFEEQIDLAITRDKVAAN